LLTTACQTLPATRSRNPPVQFVKIGRPRHPAGSQSLGSVVRLRRGRDLRPTSVWTTFSRVSFRPRRPAACVCSTIVRRGEHSTCEHSRRRDYQRRHQHRSMMTALTSSHPPRWTDDQQTKVQRRRRRPTLLLPVVMVNLQCHRGAACLHQTTTPPAIPQNNNHENIHTFLHFCSPGLLLLQLHQAGPDASKTTTYVDYWRTFMPFLLSNQRCHPCKINRPSTESCKPFL